MEATILATMLATGRATVAATTLVTAARRRPFPMATTRTACILPLTVHTPMAWRTTRNLRMALHMAMEPATGMAIVSMAVVFMVAMAKPAMEAKSPK